MNVFSKHKEKYVMQSVPVQDANYPGTTRKGPLCFPVYEEMTCDHGNTERRGSGAQTKARMAKGPMA